VQCLGGDLITKGSSHAGVREVMFLAGSFFAINNRVPYSAMPIGDQEVRGESHFLLWIFAGLIGEQPCLC